MKRIFIGMVATLFIGSVSAQSAPPAAPAAQPAPATTGPVTPDPNPVWWAEHSDAEVGKEFPDPATVPPEDKKKKRRVGVILPATAAAIAVIAVASGGGGSDDRPSSP